MIIEKFLTLYMKEATRRSFFFENTESNSPPRLANGKPCLLYIHIPFCEELCPYCSFNRVRLDYPLAVAYFSSLRKEIEIYRELGYVFDSVYIGGGTPTCLPDEIGSVIDLVKKIWPISQISIETNPNHLTPEILLILKEAGVNRLSVGVQTFNNQLLKTMDRLERYGRGEEIKERLSSIIGLFDTLNCDMIFNFPTQTKAMLDNDLDIVHEMGIDQVTFYPLMVSKATRKILSERFGRISYIKEREFFREIQERMKGASYDPSSAWCFSRKKGMIDEYIVNYGDYAGIGSGSFGYMDGTIYSNTFDIKNYIDRIKRGELPIIAKKRFSKREMMRYDFLMRLFGMSMDIRMFEEKYGISPFYELWKEILFFIAIGSISLKNGKVRLTKRGQYYWVIMMREFFTAVNNFRDYCRKI
jgi:coproporphyrinogen III oxidase-like Fe-S oxidoreductase